MNDNKTETKRIAIYVLVTFALTVAYCLGAVYPAAAGSDLSSNVMAQLLVAGMMFFPAIGVVITRLVTKEGFKNAWIRPHFKGNLRYYLAAWFGPGVLTLLGGALYFLLFPDQFDLSFGYVRDLYAAQGMDFESLGVPMGAMAAVSLVQGFFLAPLLNFFTCFGEEWGWRGYLMPKLMARMKTLPALLVSGVIWGLWHAPITVLGHNYGLGYFGYPFTGIGAMCIFCTVLGVLFSYLSLKTKSCIPAVLAHGAVNGVAAAGTMFTATGGNPFVGPAPTGIVGGLPFIAVAAVLLVRLVKEEKAQ